MPSDATGHRTFFEECIHCLEVVFQCRPVQRRLSVPPPQRLRPHLGPCSAIKPCSRGASLARLKTKQACTMPHKHLDHWNLIVERRPMHCRVTRAVTIVRSALPHLYRLFQKCHAGSNPVPKCVPLLTCTNSRFNATSHNCGKARGENPFANEVALWAASAGRDRK